MTHPQSVRDLAVRLGADPSGGISQVHFRQSGQMKLSLTSERWRTFNAEQTMSVLSCAFLWRARFRPLGYLCVVDALEFGKGRLDVSAFGILPVLRTRPTAALTKAERLRYLAELPFAPDAMLTNPALSWREVDADHLVVSCGTGPMRAEVTFELNTEGRVAGVSATDRPRSATSPTLPTPWIGAFSDYRQIAGRWVPGSGQVAWVIGGTPIWYWRGTVHDWSIGIKPEMVRKRPKQGLMYSPAQGPQT